MSIIHKAFARLLPSAWGLSEKAIRPAEQTRVPIQPRIAETTAPKAQEAKRMKFSYTVGGTQGQNDGSNAITIIDTESLDWRDRIRWIREQLGGIAEPVVRAMFQINPGADGVTPVGVHVGFVDWTHRDRIEPVSVQSVHRNPEYVVDWLSRAFMLGISGVEHLKYVPPAPPPVVEDWKVPGSPLGGPWEMNGKTLWKALYQVENATWTGPSGTVYICKRQPGLFAYYAFEVLQ